MKHVSTDTLPRGNDVVLPIIFVGLMLGWAYGTAEIEEYPKVVVGMGFGHANKVGELEGWIERAGGGKVSSEQIEEGGGPEEEGMHVGRFKNLRVAEG